MITADDALVRAHEGLVQQCVNNHQYLLSPYLEREDLVSACYLALLRAARLWNPEYNVKFSTYAVTAMHNACIQARQRAMPSGFRGRFAAAEFPQVYSLDQHARDEDGEDLESLLMAPDDPAGQALQRVSQSEVRQLVRAVLAAHPTELRVIELAFGLVDGVEWRGRDIARHLRLSRTAVSSALHRALARLRRSRELEVLR
jgi:RNA polymerase sigma factor (sigma-70 family)